jgi:serine/threonine-protein kinase
MPSSEHWRRVDALFAVAVELDEAARDAYLREQCRDDAGLRREVETLVRADRRASDDGFIANPVAAAVRDLTAGDLSRVGERVGPYRLVAELGHGGMGTVYLAERADAEYHAQVAIKFVRGALAVPELARRLRMERQVLADLQHPGIARLLDGGTAADGTPYLVMEHVEGQPIDAWCDGRRLGLRERLTLFLKVCDVVQYAHRSLVVHRDLKPSNILVQADGTPTLVDFGIAKLVDPDGSDGGDATATVRLMTPSYASPEQLLGRRVTVATDVYSLGVVLYRILTGSLPFDLAKATPAEIERRVTGEEPLRPSQVVRDRVSARQLAGDLDTIVSKALRKESERRYGTVAEFAEDVERYLDGRPVLARRDTFGYSAGKFVRRHRAGVAVAAGVLLVVSGLTGVYTARLARERDVARAEAARADRVVEFLKNVFLEASPDESEGRSLTAAQLLERGVSRVRTDLSDEPVVQADLMTVMGDVYRGLGLYEEAEAQLLQALAIRRETGAPQDSGLAELLSTLSVVTRVAGDFVAADSFAQRAVELRRRLSGTDNEPYADVLNNLAEAKRSVGDWAAAESLYREGLAIRRRIFPPVHRDIAESLNNLALLLLSEGRYGDAEAMAREALAMRIALGAPVRFEVSNGQSNLAIILTLEGKYAEAESLFVAALADRRRLFGPDEPRTLNTQQWYGRLLYEQGRYDQAERMLQDALRRMRGRVPPDHPFARNALEWLALTLSARGLHDSAVATAERAVAAFGRQVGPAHPETLEAMRIMGAVKAAAGQTTAAESLLVAAYDGQLARLGPDHPATRDTRRALAALYVAMGEPRRADRYRVTPPADTGSRSPESD